MRTNQLVVLQGPPSSGKTTWANQDALNMEFDHPPVIVRTKDLKWTHKPEGGYQIEDIDYITTTEYALIRTGIEEGRMVFLDACNNNPKRLEFLEKLAKELDCEMVVMPFYVPYDTALGWNKKRRYDKENYVPREAITEYYKKYYNEKFVDEMTDKRKIVLPDNTLPSCIICDLDVTLAMHMGRGPLDWDKIDTDKIEPRLRDMLNHYMSQGVRIMFVTGRIEAARKQTEEWLENPENKLLHRWNLYLRPGHCFDSGEDFKRKVYEEHIKDKYNVICVFEDSTRCVNMWRDLGLLTCQVATTE